MAENKGRKVVVSALQFACSDDVSTNVATAERFSSFLFEIQLILDCLPFQPKS